MHNGQFMSEWVFHETWENLSHFSHNQKPLTFITCAHQFRITGITKLHTHTHLHLMEVSGLNHDLLFICSTLVSRTSSPIVITLRIQWKINISHRLEHKSAQSTIHCVYRHFYTLFLYSGSNNSNPKRKKYIYITKSERSARMKKKPAEPQCTKSKQLMDSVVLSKFGILTVKWFVKPLTYRLNCVLKLC